MKIGTGPFGFLARTGRGLALVAMVSVLMQGWAPDAHAAAYATGGSSPYRSQVLWLTWGGGTNGADGVALNNGASTTANVSVAGSTLAVTCSINNITRLDSNGGTGGGIRSYRPGNWAGDGLDDLYNIGGTGPANQLINGISNSTVNRNYRFGITCSATLGGVAYDLPGLVVADAEQTSIQGAVTEYVQGTADGTWRLMERAVNGTCVGRDYRGSLNTSGSNQVLRLSAGTTSTNDCPNAGSAANYGPMGVGFLTFDSTAYSGANRQVTTTFELYGNATGAIAIGLLVPYADFGDAPGSYGTAAHVSVPALTADGLVSGSTVNVMAGGFALATFMSPATDKVGSLWDADGNGLTGNAGATTDDASGIDDEDAVTVSALPALSVISDGQTYTVPVACTGTGSVAGWIDFNVDGDFLDAGERSGNTAACAAGGGSVNLTFAVPSGANLVSGQSYLRVRYSLAPATELGTPSGAARSGEVEDHALTILPAVVRIRKTTSGGTGSFSFAATNLATTPIVVSTTGTNPNTSATNVIQTTADVTLTETPPGGWVLSSASCVDANSATTGNPASFGTLAGNVLTIPQANIRAGVDITCSFANTFAQIDLSITKTNTPAAGAGDQAGDTVVAGGQTTYDLVIRNQGPSTAVNAILNDPAPTGLANCTLGTPGCAVTTGTATCPSVGADAGQLSVANLQSAGGVLIPLLSPNSSITIKLVCTVQ
jgi:uncharacterized repeat protein (TIGR01451 family)